MINFLNNLKSFKPNEYHRLIQGVISLRRYYTSSQIDAACMRADRFGCYSFKSVKRICEQGLFEVPADTDISVTGGGYGNELSSYDKLNREGAK